MSLLSSLDYIARQAGINTIVLRHPDGEDSRGDESHVAVSKAALDFFKITKEPRTTSYVGDHTITCFRKGPEQIAVVFPKGHEIAKSLVRLIDKSSKRAGPPKNLPSDDKPRAPKPKRPKVNGTPILNIPPEQPKPAAEAEPEIEPQPEATRPW